MAEKGLDIGAMQLKLLLKIEELTLYTLQQHETIKQLDFRAEKKFNLTGGGRTKLGVIFDLYNVFNANTVLNLNARTGRIVISETGANVPTFQSPYAVTSSSAKAAPSASRSSIASVATAPSASFITKSRSRMRIVPLSTRSMIAGAIRGLKARESRR